MPRLKHQPVLQHLCARRLALLVWACVGWILTVGAISSVARGEDSAIRVTFADSTGETRTVEGRIEVTAQDGGILLLGRDGRLWNVPPKNIQRREEAGKKFSPLSHDEIAAELLNELNTKFTIIKTKHFVVATTAESEYGKWCGEMFEALLKSFLDHWRSQKLDLHEPEFPLVAVVFPNQTLFTEYALKEGGEQARSSHGYYWVPSNRIVLYDLTADLPVRSTRRQGDIRDRLEASSYNVATVVHEATHQIAFNCGMHTRLADNPLWLTEGLAMYCETPDFKSRTGWRTIGSLNKKRLGEFQNFVRQRRKPDSLKTLLSDGKRFGDPQRAGETYAEAWALTYFLNKTQPGPYAAYLKKLSEKQPLMWETPESRLKEFQTAFGEDLEQLDREFLKFTRRLSPR